MKNNYLIAVVGPTAIGKTSLSIALANYFNTEIISADSRQFYKEMSIGTAVPSTSELKSATHNFIQHKSVTESYSVGDFEYEAINTLDSIFNKKDTAIMVGGSGLYIDAVIKGLNHFPEVEPIIRERLNDRAKIEGLENLTSELKALDPETYNSIDLNNPHRVIRALEVCISSSKPYSYFLNLPKAKRTFQPIYVGLKADRKILYDRINLRVDQMVNEGLVEEVKSLLKFRHYNALNTVGYKEVFKFLDGECTLDFAISEIKKNTRRFAKRQLTWFRKNENINWFNFENELTTITSFIDQKILSYENE